jgi:phosphodiesterase/alkaline phosphatase D-like protein
MQQFTLRAFNASGNHAGENSVDYIIHLGDYIYEDKNGDNGLSATK